MKNFCYLLFSSFCLFIMGCTSPPSIIEDENTLKDKFNFYGIDLLRLNQAPVCPERFFASEIMDRTNIFKSHAEYLCRQAPLGDAILIPKDNNPLNAVWIRFVKPFSESERFRFEIQFNSGDDSERIKDYLIRKYGNPRKVGEVLRWDFRNEGLSVDYKSVYDFPQVKIFSLA